MSIVIVHVSDLHFGRDFVPPFASNGTAYAGPAPTQPPPAIRGFAQHDLNACDELEVRLRRLAISKGWNAPQGAPLKLLVASGDLTVCGHETEFSHALTFLQSSIAVSWDREVGLGKLGFSDTLAVPGNHDHWRGARFRSAGMQIPQRGIHGLFFRSGPSSSCWFREYVQAKGLVLQLMGIDSSAGAAVQLLARGRFDPNDFTALDREIAASNQRLRHHRIVRVLVVHHGLQNTRWSHGLDAASASALNDFIQRNRVHRLLSGHLHSPFLSNTELRCGTTLQRQRRTGKQTFLLHELSDGVGGVIKFDTTVFERGPAGRFRDVKIHLSNI